MTSGELLIGTGGLALVAGGGWLVAVRIRRRWLPRCSGAVAHLVDAVTGLAAIVAVSQVLGAIGAFRAPALVAGVAAVAVASLRLEDRSLPRAAAVVDHGPSSRRAAVVAVVLVAVVAGQWTSVAVDATDEGVRAADSIWYHLPRAAEFVQSGSLTDLHYTAPEFPDTFHPSNAELVQSVPMLFYGRDVLSPILNHGWLALLLLAAWCVGAAKGRGAASVAGASALMATPLLVIEGAGNAGNDIAAAFLLVASVALLLRRDDGWEMAAVAGVAAGLAISTKLTVVPAVAVLTLGLVFSGAPSRARTIVAWTVPLLAFGSYWYLRNWIAVGTPVPSTDLPFLPAPRFRIADELGYSVFDYATDTSVWRRWFAPGLRADFGLLWLLALSALPVAVVGAWRARDLPQARWIGLALAAATATYVGLPTTALGPPGRPLLFAGNVIYLVPALILAISWVPLSLPARSVRAERLFLGAAAVVALSAVTTSHLDTWAPGRSLVAVVTTAGVGAVGALVLVPRLRPPPVAVRVVAAASVALVVVALGASVDGRYRDEPLYAWANRAEVDRVAVAGFAGAYPLYGADLDNEVTYVGVQGDHGELHDHTTCSGWRHALRVGGFDHVALRPERYDTDAAHARWMQADPAATRWLERPEGQVYRFDPRVPDPGCEAEVP